MPHNICKQQKINLDYICKTCWGDKEMMAERYLLDFTEDNVNICDCHILPIYHMTVLT